MTRTAEPAPVPVALVAGRLGCTEGQLYTMVVGLVVALLLGIPGIPAALRDRPARQRTEVALRPFGGGQSATPTSIPVAVAPPAATTGDVNVVPPFRVPPVGVSAATASPTAAVDSPSESPGEVDVRTAVPGTIEVFARIGHPGAPGGIAVAADGTVHVTTDNGTARGSRGASHVFSFDPAGRPTADRTITGQRAGRVGGLTGAAVDPIGGDIAVLDPDGARILGIDVASGAQTVLATVPDLPACLVSLGVGLCQPGVEDRRPSPASAVYDHARNLYFSDPAQGTIWRLRPGSRSPDVWYQSSYFPSGDGPDGLVLRRGSVHFTVGRTIDPSALDAGALYRLTVDAEGDAGELTLVHAFASGDRPGPLAVASDGIAYVVLRNSGAIVSLAPDGSRSGRIDPPGAGPIPLDAPSAVAIVPGGLLVANGRTSADPTRWAVLKVVLGR